MRRTTLLATASGAIVLALASAALPATAAPSKVSRAVESTSALRPSERAIAARQEPAPDITGVLAFTPDAYQDGNALKIAVSGSVSVTSERALQCIGIRLGAFGNRNVAIEYKFLSPDKLSAVPGVAQTLSISDELVIDQARLQELPVGQALTVYVWADCYYSGSPDGWDSDPFYVTFAEHTIAPPSIQLRVDEEWIFPELDFVEARPKWHKTATKLNFFSSGVNPTLTVLRNGNPVWTFQATASRGTASLPMSVVAPRATYTVRITAGQMPQVRVPLPVFHGVAGLFSMWGPEEPIITWPKCSTIRWHYDASKAPKSAGTFVAELEQVMNYFSRVTGVRFQRAEKGTANFFIGWVKEIPLNPWAAGEGGFVYVNGVATTGTLNLVYTKEWARTPGMKSPGRGPLIFHELGHAMGLGHVVSEDSLMYPIYNFGKAPNRPSKLEEAFLKEIYRPETCS